MKTVFITSFHAHISRNLFSTQLLDLLRESRDLQVVILIPPGKTEYFKENYGGENIRFEEIRLYRASRTKRGLFFKKVAKFLMPSETRKLKLSYKYYKDKKHFYYFFARTMMLFGGSMIFRGVFRFFDYHISPKGYFDVLLDRYKPELIISSDLHNENDVSLMQDTKRRNISVLGMFRSWDNPTQSVLRVFPEKLLVGSRMVYEETAILQGYPRNRIVITGNPHYDRYLSGPSKSKEEFFSEFGFDLNKKLILFTPVGDKFFEYNDFDQHVMKLLGEVDAQILVRFPPAEHVTLSDRFIKPVNMVFDRPGHVFREGHFNDREISPKDDRRLVNSILYSDLVVTGPTSILLDASFFDCCVIGANISPEPRAFLDTNYCFGFSHIKRALTTGGIRYVESKDQLFHAVNMYLADASHDTKGRKTIRDYWFSHADGKAGERIYKEITSLVF